MQLRDLEELSFPSPSQAFLQPVPFWFCLERKVCETPMVEPRKLKIFFILLLIELIFEKLNPHYNDSWHSSSIYCPLLKGVTSPERGS